jgi:hypothetical protein
MVSPATAAAKAACKSPPAGTLIVSAYVSRVAPAMSRKRAAVSRRERRVERSAERKPLRELLAMSMNDLTSVTGRS